MKSKQNVIILGSTGSIGTSALEVIENNQDKFAVKYLSTNTRVVLLLEQAKNFQPEGIIITDDEAFKELKLANLPFKVYSRSDLTKIIVEEDIDVVIAAMVGFAGLESTLEAAKSGKKIALANKEHLLLLVISLQNMHNNQVQKLSRLIQNIQLFCSVWLVNKKIR